MKKSIFFLIMPLVVSAAGIACKKQTDPIQNSTGSGSGKGIVSGKITDAAGKPIRNAKVTVEHTVWYDSYVFATTNDQGAYSITIPASPAGDWTAKAQLTVDSYGQTYKFDLDPDRNDAFTNSGNTVRNFTWKLNGARPGGQGYYGAHVDLYQMGTDVDLTKVKIQFTPYPGEKYLIDGSPVVAFGRNVEDVAGTFMVKDVPIGKYTIKAIYPGKKLLLDNRHADDNSEESKTVIFGKAGYLGETEYNIEFYVSE
ncbi:MAG TPA: carboxypeptidase-like regulatory domain-containing protein [Flavisolibacter sp.]|nr:carboxypeptidase-like regulatory domain-containing protein [Flavisolibacter sp.]